MRFVIPDFKARHLARLTQWHPWFAWHPVKVNDETWVWWETILRCGVAGSVEVETFPSALRGAVVHRRWHEPERKPVTVIVSYDYAPYPN